MNIQDFIAKMKEEINRITGLELTPDMTEDNVLDQLNATPSLAKRTEDVESMVLELSEKMDALTAAMPKEMSAEMVSEIAMNAAAESSKAMADNLNTKLSELSKEFGSVILELKQTAEESKKPAGEVLESSIDAVEEVKAAGTLQRKIGGKTIEVKAS